MSDFTFTFTTEAEDIKKRWQEYTEELYKKDLHDPDNHDGMITHLEPDILECEVEWALGSIKKMTLQFPKGRCDNFLKYTTINFATLIDSSIQE